MPTPNQPVGDGGIIYHIASRQDYQRQCDSGEYLSDSLESEGFIHCCGSRKDLQEIAGRLYAGQRGLIVLDIDPARLTSTVRWERAPGDHEPDRRFPHIYGPINLNAVVGLSELTL